VPPVTTPTQQPSTSPAWVRKNDTRTPVTPQPEEPVRQSHVAVQMSCRDFTNLEGKRKGG
jgi:hypothetical protein